ncbi:MAG: hypothetical protein JJU28_06595 [Cyclobacteriaceae bacterium]|nr:hypothetical protein [Cyclobacteriaceae bacterium]
MRKLHLNIMQLLIMNCCLGQTQQLTQDEARQDFDFYVKTLESKHTNPATHFPDFQTFKDSLLSTFPDHSGNVYFLTGL